VGPKRKPDGEGKIQLSPLGGATTDRKKDRSGSGILQYPAIGIRVFDERESPSIEALPKPCKLQ